MRRRLACDLPELDIIGDERIPLEHANSGAQAVVKLWIAEGRRVVLLEPAALARLAEVPLELSHPVAVAGQLVAYVSGLAGPLQPATETQAALDGAWVLVDAGMKALLETGGRSRGRFLHMITILRPGDRVTTPGPHYARSRDDEQAEHASPEAIWLDRVLVGAVAALLDPLWVRSVVVRTETQQAPRRARKRQDPRAAPVEVLRLTPDAHHVVRHQEPVVVAGPGPGARRHVGRGIVLGAPIAEHDVRGHVRRHMTTRAHAEARGWAVEDWPTLASLCGDDVVVALVPVRPHVRGRGPRRETVIRGPG